jgi:hypothetical protein
MPICQIGSHKTNAMIIKNFEESINKFKKVSKYVIENKKRRKSLVIKADLCNFAA